MPFRVGLLGHGTVGSSFARLLEERADAIEAEVGMRPRLSGVLTRSRGDFGEILEGSDLVVELMGGIDPTREYVLRAMEAGLVPAIRVMAETLAAAHIERVHGIVNGTTNYILTQMAATGATYEEALA